MKHTPATPPSFTVTMKDYGQSLKGLRVEGNHCNLLCDGNGNRLGEIDTDMCAGYLAHAANAYPELVEALSKLLKHRDGQIVHRASLERAEALLRSLGEES